MLGDDALQPGDPVVEEVDFCDEVGLLHTGCFGLGKAHCFGHSNSPLVVVLIIVPVICAKQKLRARVRGSEFIG